MSGKSRVQLAFKKLPRKLYDWLKQWVVATGSYHPFAFAFEAPDNIEIPQSFLTEQVRTIVPNYMPGIFLRTSPTHVTNTLLISCGAWRIDQVDQYCNHKEWRAADENYQFLNRLIMQCKNHDYCGPEKEKTEKESVPEEKPSAEELAKKVFDNVLTDEDKGLLAQTKLEDKKTVLVLKGGNLVPDSTVIAIEVELAKLLDYTGKHLLILGNSATRNQERMVLRNNLPAAEPFLHELIKLCQEHKDPMKPEPSFMDKYSDKCLIQISTSGVINLWCGNVMSSDMKKWFDDLLEKEGIQLTSTLRPFPTHPTHPQHLILLEDIPKLVKAAEAQYPKVKFSIGYNTDHNNYPFKAVLKNLKRGREFINVNGLDQVVPSGTKVKVLGGERKKSDIQEWVFQVEIHCPGTPIHGKRGTVETYCVRPQEWIDTEWVDTQSPVQRDRSVEFTIYESTGRVYFNKGDTSRGLKEAEKFNADTKNFNFLSIENRIHLFRKLLKDRGIENYKFWVQKDNHPVVQIAGPGEPFDYKGIAEKFFDTNSRAEEKEQEAPQGDKKMEKKEIPPRADHSYVVQPDPVIEQLKQRTQELEKLLIERTAKKKPRVWTTLILAAIAIGAGIGFVQLNPTPDSAVDGVMNIAGIEVPEQIAKPALPVSAVILAGSVFGLLRLLLKGTAWGGSKAIGGAKAVGRKVGKINNNFRKLGSKMREGFCEGKGTALGWNVFSITSSLALIPVSIIATEWFENLPNEMSAVDYVKSFWTGLVASLSVIGTFVMSFVLRKEPLDDKVYEVPVNDDSPKEV